MAEVKITNSIRKAVARKIPVSTDAIAYAYFSR